MQSTSVQVAWKSTNISNLGQYNDLFARELELLDRLSENNLRLSIGINLHAYSDRILANNRMRKKIRKVGAAYIGRIERLDSMVVRVLDMRKYLFLIANNPIRPFG